MSSERKWPIEHPDRIQLYSLATPNGQKVGIALEEVRLPYEAHKVNIGQNEQFTDEFKAINPNSKIPTISDGVVRALYGAPRIGARREGVSVLKQDKG